MRRSRGYRALRWVLPSLLLIVLPFQGAPTGNPTIALSRATAPAGSRIAISGASFPPSTAAMVTVGDATVGRAQTTSSGALHTTFVVPPSRTGRVMLRVAARGTAATKTLVVHGSNGATPPLAKRASPRTTVEETTAAPVGPPQRVTADQGPTKASALYVLVTWDRNDPAAVGYDVLRDGVVVHSVTLQGDAWNDFAFRDNAVSGGHTYAYQVRARYADGARSALSWPATVAVRADQNIGSGRTFLVDSYAGTDLQRAQAAVAAARAAGGGVVLFGPRVYRFDAPLTVVGDDVVLRGAGTDATYLQADFAGIGDPCGQGGELVKFVGAPQNVTGGALAAPIARGDRIARVTSTAGLAVGQVIVLDQSGEERSPADYAAAGIAQDPATGNDARLPYETNQIVAITGNVVSFKDAFTYPFSTSVQWRRIGQDANDQGVELLTVEGRSATDTSMYRLISLQYVTNFTVADVRARWANRSDLEVKGYNVHIVGFDGADAGAAGYDRKPCKYKISVFRAANVNFVGGSMGNPTDDRNQSFVTFQKGQRFLVRDSRFYESRTYALNEHGSGSSQNVFENNYLATGASAQFGAILLGNPSWGFSGQTLVRNNTFVGNVRDLYLEENSYRVAFIGNTSRANRYRVVDGYGWAGPSTDPSLFGSLRLTIAGNSVSDARGDGVVLGYKAGAFPFLGVRDVVIANNHLGVHGFAVKLFGPSASTHDFHVHDNSGTARYLKPGLVPSDYWARNGDTNRSASMSFKDDFRHGKAGDAVGNGWTLLREYPTGMSDAPTISYSGAWARLSIWSSATTPQAGYALRPEVLADSVVAETLKLWDANGRYRWGLVARHGGTTWDADCYSVQVSPSGTNRIALLKRVAGVEHVIGRSTALDHHNHGDVRLKFAVVGHRLSVKVWPVGAAEPSAWTIAVTDTDIAAPGLSGFFGSGPAGTTSRIDQDDFAMRGTTAATTAYGAPRAIDWSAGS